MGEGIGWAEEERAKSWTCSGDSLISCPETQGRALGLGHIFGNGEYLSGS